MIRIKKDVQSARETGGRIVSGSRLASIAGLASASVLLASCATDTPSADTGSEPAPVNFTSDSQCTRAATMIPNQPSATAQLANWAQACATRAQDSGLAVKSSINALQNASKLYFAAGDYNLAAENGAAAKRLLDSLPGGDERNNNGKLFRFDSAFVEIAPTLALGLSESGSNGACGSNTACLTSGLEALEAVEFGAVRPILNNSPRYYQAAAATLQTLNAKANAALASSGNDGNVDKSLSVLKSIISIAPVAGNEGLRGAATDTLVKIAKSGAAEAVKDPAQVSSAIRYLSEAVQVAPAGDSRREVNFKLGGANEARADSLLSNQDSSDNNAGLASYCDGAKAYQLAFDHSNKLIALEAREGYAYALSQIESEGGSNCNTTQALAVAAFESSEQYRATNSLPGHKEYLDAYGALLNRALDFDGSAKAFQAADLATRKKPVWAIVKPIKDDPRIVRFEGGDPRANSSLSQAVIRTLSDDPAVRAQAEALFERSQSEDGTWPTSFLEHGKYLAKTGDARSSAKLTRAIDIATGKPEWSSQLAEAYHERSRNALRVGSGAAALSDAASAVLTNSADSTYRQQACLAALYAEKGRRTATSVRAYCPNANTAAADGALSTEDLLLNAFRKHRDAQLLRRSANIGRKIQAFDAAAEAYRQIALREDKTDATNWVMPSGAYSFGNVATIGAWAADACGSPTGPPPIPNPPNAATIIELFDAYGLQQCDVQ